MKVLLLALALASWADATLPTRTGDPNGRNLPRWPKFDPVARAYLDFTGSGPVAREGLRWQICDLYAEQLKREMAR